MIYTIIDEINTKNIPLVTNSEKSPYIKPKIKLFNLKAEIAGGTGGGHETDGLWNS